MFLTQAEIKTYDQFNHLYGISIPMLVDKRNLGDDIVVWASTSETSGILTNYEVGDYVFVTFSDNSLNKPVILGKIRHRNSKYNVSEAITSYDDQADSIYCDTLYCNRLTYYEGNESKPTNQNLAGKNSNVKAQIDRLRSRVYSLETDVYKSTADDVKEATGLQIRATNLETDVDKLQADVAELQNDVIVLQTAVADLQSLTNTLSSHLNSLTNRVITLEGSNSDLVNRISTLETRISNWPITGT